jgi:hypothetical protein
MENTRTLLRFGYLTLISSKPSWRGAALCPEQSGGCYRGFIAHGPITARYSDSPANVAWHSFLYDVIRPAFQAAAARVAGRGNRPISLTA